MRTLRTLVKFIRKIVPPISQKQPQKPPADPPSRPPLPMARLKTTCTLAKPSRVSPDSLS